MKILAVVGFVLVATFLVGARPVWAQGLETPLVTAGPGWKTCPRCENTAHIDEARKQANVDAHPFDPHDLSGVWGDNGIPIETKTRPPLTPEGRKLEDVLKKAVGQAGDDDVPLNDPLTTCDPLGSVRAFGYNYGMEFVQTPSRVFQFIEWSHTWRTIWTDGRKLPDDPPVARYLGYNVGRWEGDTFIVESNGFDQRALVGSDGGHPLFPHSPDMRIVEAYKRLDYGKLQASITIIDPKVFEKPWTTIGTAKLLPNAEIAEYFCVPSESINFNEKVTLPSLRSTSKDSQAPR